MERFITTRKRKRQMEKRDITNSKERVNRDNMVKLYNKIDGNSIKFNLTNIFLHIFWN